MTPSDGSFLVVAKVNGDDDGNTLHVGALNTNELQAHYSAHASEPCRLSYGWKHRKCSYLKEMPPPDANEVRLSFSTCVLPFFVILTCLYGGFRRRTGTKRPALHTVGVAAKETKRTLTSLGMCFTVLDWRLCCCPPVIPLVMSSTKSTRWKVQSLPASLTKHFAVSFLVGFTSATRVAASTSQEATVHFLT